MSTVAPFSGYTTTTTSVITFSQSLNAFNEGSFQFFFNVPQSLPNGSYFIYIDVDTGGVVSEFSESDNHTISGKILRLTSTC